MTDPGLTSVLESQRLMQLGERLRRLRKAQGLGTVEMASRIGIARNTLRAIEAGDPKPSIGSYLGAMSVLGVSGELALLASETLQPTTPAASARLRHLRPTLQVRVSTDESRHKVQDQRSIVLHEAAVRLVESDPYMLHQARVTLDAWLQKADPRSAGMWKEWDEIQRQRKWRKILGRTRRAQELRQASPLIAVLPEATRLGILDQVNKLKVGMTFGS